MDEWGTFINLSTFGLFLSPFLLEFKSFDVLKISISFH